MRVGGIIEVKSNGELYSAKGSWTYNLGKEKRETVLGSDTTHGFKTAPQEAMIAGAITDNIDLNLETLVLLEDATITLRLANGKIIVLKDGFFAGDGNGTTEEGEIEVKFVSATGTADEIRA